MNIPESSYPRVVVVGGGFAGSEMVRKLSAYPFQIILLDRNNYFTFQPLLYQVATAGLETNSVVSPLRRLFRADENILFRVGELKEVDS